MSNLQCRKGHMDIVSRQKTVCDPSLLIYISTVVLCGWYGRFGPLLEKSIQAPALMRQVLLLI